VEPPVTTTAPAPPDGVGIRRAEGADLPAVLRIERASFPQPWPPEAFEHYCGQPGFLVATDAAAPVSVVGFAVADTTIADGRVDGHLKDLAVHPDHRGRGIGSALLWRALRALDECDVARTRLEVRAGNGAARRLYRRFGFEPVARDSGYYRDGEDAVVMTRTA
jgi:ribosomal-protein-alanine N-acetyltransferase